MRSHSTRQRRLAGLVGGVAISTLVLAGCTADGGSDTSTAGQVAYACGLSEAITSPETWETSIGDEADPGAVAAQATISLLAGHSLYELPDHPELTEAARELGQAVQAFDSDAFDAALADITAGCRDIEPPTEPATDQEGQLTYACALANAVKSERGDAESWGSYSEDPAWHEAFSAAALVGAANSGTIPGAENLAEAASDLARSAQGLPDGAQAALDAFIDGCDA